MLKEWVMNMKKIVISLIILFTLSGCWNYKELNDYSIVTGIAIDKKDDKYEVGVLISNAPKSSGDNSESSQSQIVVYQEQGDSLFEAFKNIGLISPKELYIGSFSILVVSEDVARDGLESAIDLFVRYTSARNNFYIAIAKDAKAVDTLKIVTPLTSFPSQNIADNLKSTTDLQGTIAKTSFNDLLSIILRDGIDPAINTISVVGNADEGEEKENLESSVPKSYIKIGNLALFKNDKLVDFTTHDESLGINIVNNKISEMYLKLDYNDGYVIVDTTSFKSSVKTSVKNNEPIVDINIEGEARVIEVKGDINLEDYKVIEELEKKSNNKIKSHVNEAFSKAVKNKTDVFGFGLKFYQNHPKYFKSVKDDWDNVFGNIKLNIKSSLILKTKVSSKNSLEEIHSEKKDY